MVKKEDILWVHRENIRLVSGGGGSDVEGAFDFPLSDNDGVNDKVEYDHGTNPQDEDTDNDGLSDRQEIYYYGTYAYTWDSDEDGMSDNDEFYNWLFMLYLDGDNNLESEIEDIMWQITMGLNAVGSVSQVKQVIHVVAQYDGRNWGDSVRYEIKANTLEWEKVKVEDLGEVAMSAPGTLSGFVNWAVDRIWQPNRRALIIVDHGGGWQDPKIHNERYALIIIGGGWNDPYETEGDTYLPAFWNDGKAMYDKLVNDYHYSPENVYLMSSRWYCKYDGSWGWRGHNHATDGIVDGEAMWDVPGKYDIKDALDEIARKITVHDSLLITVIAHGGYYNENEGFFIVRSGVSSSEAENNPASQKHVINCGDSWNGNLGAYLTQQFGGNDGITRRYAVMTIVLQTCDSESLMYNLEGDRRIVIAGARWNETAWSELGGDDHWAFLWEGRHMVFLSDWSIWKDEKFPGFIRSLGTMLVSPHSIYQAFCEGSDAATHNFSEMVGRIIRDGRSHLQMYNHDLAEEIYL